jgi:hypothetical protein
VEPDDRTQRSILGSLPAGSFDDCVVLLLGRFSDALVRLRTTMLRTIDLGATCVCRAVPGLSRQPQIDKITHLDCLAADGAEHYAGSVGPVPKAAVS